MRKSRVEANETRKRIVETAARELRGKGVVGAGIADIMSAAGLTPGGFYRHFESKDHLVAEACDVASATLYQTLESFVQGKPPREARREIAERYLSVTHRDNMSIGCPFAALGGDMARADSCTRQVATDGFLRLAGLIAEQLGGTEASKRGKSLAAASAMIGALMMSRVVDNEALSQEILQAARDALCR
ncbi:hypothetical protein BKK79_06280 [Cupriavidus sp. USMAA2-4]|nr:hypothetical protein BKK79_06280 [Cupriavidus sp. USMAA2-4]